MSFSQDVKAELLEHYSKSGPARKAELAALMMLAGKNVKWDAGSGRYIYDGFADTRKTFNIGGEINKAESLEKITGKAEAKRAFLRGAFIAAGTVNSPLKDYHFEISAPDEGTADFISGLFEEFDVFPKVTERRGRYIAYLKDSEEIATALNVIEAHTALMTFENARIEKEINGAVNRKINCDTANINKALSAAMKQIEDIELIDEVMGLETLEPSLEDICRVRLANPDATLEEIAAMCTPPVGKSGANHRFRKIAETASRLRT